MTRIQWTDKTWNPVLGCKEVSPGCANCYAARWTHQLAQRDFGAYRGLTVLGGDGQPHFVGKAYVREDEIGRPLRWRKPCRVFVCSMSDLFHEDVADELLDQIFAVMAMCPQHQFQVLTKRPERMLRYMTQREPLPNVWLGVSAEDQKWLDKRVKILREIPAAIRFLSLEPLLEQIDLTYALRPSARPNGGIHWVIVGGETGPGARPFHVGWAESVIEQCREEGVPVFVKQLGGKAVYGQSKLALKDRKGGDPSEWPEALCVREWPEVATTCT